MPKYVISGSISWCNGGSWNSEAFAQEYLAKKPIRSSADLQKIQSELEKIRRKRNPDARVWIRAFSRFED